MTFCPYYIFLSIYFYLYILILFQLEPYITHAALYDVSRGCKISEDFHFDVNNPMARSLLSRAKKKSDDPKECVGTSLPLSLSGIPEEWIAHPKQVSSS